MSPFVKIQDWLADFFSGDDSIRANRTRTASILSVLSFPFRLLWAFSIFMVQAWTSSRSGSAFLLGLPAVTVVAGCIAVAWASTFYFTRFTVGRTMGAYAKYAKADDSAAEVLMFGKKLVEALPEEPEAKYKLGLAFAGADEIPNAVNIMKSIAPLGIEHQAPPGRANPDLEGDVSTELENALAVDVDTEDSETDDRETVADYAPAHLWLAAWYQKDLAESGFDEQKDQRTFEHLEAASILEPENRMPQISLAGLYQNRAQAAKGTDEKAFLENLKNAEQALQESIKPPLTNLQQVAQIPRLILVKQELMKAEGNKDQERLREYFTDIFEDLLKVSSKAPDEVRLIVYQQVINGMVNLKDFDKAVTLIEEAVRSFDDIAIKRRLIRTAGLIFLKSAEENEQLETESQYQKYVFSICSCLRSNPREKDAYVKLIALANLNQREPEKFEWLQSTLVNSPLVAVNHLLIGINLLMEGETEKGVNHWKVAYSLSPVSQVLLSNIIDVATFDYGLTIDKLPEITDQAIELFPEQGILYQSQGVLRMRAGDIKAAIESFEMAIDRDARLIRSHQFLATCYEKVGNSQKASEYQKKVEEILQQMEPAQQANVRKLLDQR